MEIDTGSLLVAEIVNYSLKGLIAGVGRGTGFTKHVRLLSLKVNLDDDLSSLVNAIAETRMVDYGNIVVLPSKVVAIVEKRFVHGLTVRNYQRCVTDLEYARQHLTMEDGSTLTERDQIGLDKIDPRKKLGLAYPSNPNRSAHEIAKLILQRTGAKVDAVISDSDAGSKKGMALIGCPSILVTPIGATRGLRLFYCMRVAVAAELSWNNNDSTPVLLVQPSTTSSHLKREFMGELRYEGFLDATREEDILYFKRIRQ